MNIYFEAKDIHSLHETSEFLLTIFCVQAQDKSESKNTDPESKYYQRKCYSYKHDKNGHLIPNNR